MLKIITTFIVVVLAVTLINCKPDYDKSEIVSYINSPNDGSGNYYFMFKNSDGTYREEMGDNKNDIMEVVGLYSYIVSNKTYVVSYKADSNGYRIVPQGDLGECTVSSECAQNKACVNQKCVDPCPFTCGRNAKCSVINHNPICSCQFGLTGDPFVVCFPMLSEPSIPDEPIEASVLCSLLGRCANEGGTGDINPEASS